MTSHLDRVIAHYSANAEQVRQRFAKSNSDVALSAFLEYLPAAAAQILDIGAGSGRDALFFAERGHQVTAVEPAEALRKIGEELTRGSGVVWEDDRLPELKKLRSNGQKFDFICLNAVWMFLPPDLRLPSLQTLADLLQPSGYIGMNVQKTFGPRQEFKSVTSEAEFSRLADMVGLSLDLYQVTADSQARDEIEWQRVVYQKS